MTEMKKIPIKREHSKIYEARDEEFEKANFYETLLDNLMNYKEIVIKDLKEGDICLYFDVWREPYRSRDGILFEAFMEIIIGKVEKTEPLTLSKTICLNTYQECLRYTENSLTWSRGASPSPNTLILIDFKLFQELKEALEITKWTHGISYEKKNIITLVRSLENYFDIKLPSKEEVKTFEKAGFYEPLLTILMNQERLKTKDPEIGDIYVYFDVWREPYRSRDGILFEAFMEIIIGRISNIDPLTFSEAISLDTYHDKITYSTDSLTWSRGSIIPIHELISVDNELFHRMKLMLRPKKWEGCVSFNRKHITAFVRNLENHFTGKYAGKNFKVVNRKVLVKDSEQQNPIISLELEAPEIASEAAPGQFVVIRLHERGERIPLTIVDTKKSKGLIQIIFQVVGTTTEELAAITKGAFILDILGPLGNPIEVKKYDKPIICIAGGVGAASIYAKVKALKNKGNYIISIIGAKTKTSLILEDEMRQISDELYLTTDDGSYDFTKDGIECLYKKRVNGDKIYGGFVTNVLEALFGQYKLLTKENERIKKYSKRFMDYGPPQMVDFHSPNSIAKVIAVGPIPMMRAVVDVIAGDGEYNPKRDYRENILPIHVSLNPIMVDGTGLCGSCRVRIYNYEKAEFETKFACVDGPTFNGLLVDFESLLRRTIQYKPKEQKSEKYLEISGW